MDSLNLRQIVTEIQHLIWNMFVGQNVVLTGPPMARGQVISQNLLLRKLR